MSNKLSKTMIEVINLMNQYNKKLIRLDGGFWTYENSEIKYYMRKHNRVKPMFSEEKLYEDDIPVPIWHCDVKTLRALEKRNLLIFDEDKEVCYSK